MQIDVLNCVIIFLAKVLELSLDTLRMNFLVREKKGIGAIIGFIEVVIWITVVRKIINEPELNLFTIISYAGGYAVGNYLGSFIEQKLAIGNVTVEAIVNKRDDALPNLLRENGFGVSVVDCKGKDEMKNMLIIVANRKSLGKVKSIITEFDNNAFITILETKNVVNGYFK